MDGWIDAVLYLSSNVLMYHVAFPSNDTNQYSSISSIWFRLNYVPFLQCLHTTFTSHGLIDFPSFLPPLMTVGRLGSDSGQLLLGGRREARRDDTTHETSGLTSCSHEEDSVPA